MPFCGKRDRRRTARLMPPCRKEDAWYVFI
jgi:hypothetical protein